MNIESYEVREWYYDSSLITKGNMLVIGSLTCKVLLLKEMMVLHILQ